MSIEASEEMAASFGGALLSQGDEYEAARLVHNGMVDKRPGLIARCVSTADVRDAVDMGRESGAEISVRGGGHNVAGLGLT